MKHYVIAKLVAGLQRISDKDLQELAAILEDPGAARALPRLIRETLALRQAERKTRRKQRAIRSVAQEAANAIDYEPPRRGPVGSHPEAGDEIKPMLFKTLEDRRLYPSTRDVIDAINSHFQCQLNYEDYRRNGRLPAIRTCWKQLRDLPRRKRARLLRAFFASIEHQTDEFSEYRELFRVLTRHE